MSEFFQFPEVVVVEASAGSGKTYTLAKRYVQLALYLAKQKNIPIQSILAITFTNKATWEMKSRILDFLKRISLKILDSSEIEDILLPLDLDEQNASSLGFALMEEVIHQYHYFQVQTIDSFINTLLSGCSFKIGLSSRFKIQRNSRDYLQLALDELLQVAKTDKKTYQLFESFVRQYLFLENRWGWFPKEDLLNVMAALFRPYNTYQKSLIKFPCKEDLFVKKRQIYSLIQGLQPLCPQETNKHFINHLTSFLQAGERIFDVDELKHYWAKEEFPINKGGVVTDQVEQLWESLHKEIHDLCWLESHSMFNSYIGLFEVLLSHFYQLSKRDDILFLEELNRKAAALFDDELVTVEELYFRLAARFKHYLVDEFQDTSLAQWRNLSPMVHEALASDGSLFYVGDKKQAIYAFRGGESRLFDALQSQLSTYVKTQNLDKNYRSFSNIIKFNNEIFDPNNLRAFLERKYEDDREHKREGIYFNEEDFAQFVNTFGHATQSSGKDLFGGVVRVEHLSGRTKGEYTLDAKERLIVLINQVRQRFDLQDIAVLTRGNQEVEEITQWLLMEGIPAQSERNSDIKNNPLIAEVIELLRFLQSPIDNKAFAKFCLGELLPKASGISEDSLQLFLFECARLKSKHKDFYFYREFRQRFPEVWEKLFEPFFRQVGIYPLYELAAGILARFNCECLFPQYQGFLMHLLQLIKTKEEESCDLAVFL
ncbi:MAG: UvrD-helicase domain-containing protein, partial [Candidatus Omnitrophota bacterium]